MRIYTNFVFRNLKLPLRSYFSKKKETELDQSFSLIFFRRGGCGGVDKIYFFLRWILRILISRSFKPILTSKSCCLQQFILQKIEERIALFFYSLIFWWRGWGRGSLWIIFSILQFLISKSWPRARHNAKRFFYTRRRRFLKEL